MERLVVQHLAAAGVATSLIDWPIWFPIIENRWTSTFALYAGGWSYLALEMFADLGFRACVAFSGHWPGDVLLSEMQKELGVVGGIAILGGGTVSLLREQQDEMTRKDPLLGGHGMMWQTSLVMAINERWTDLSRVDAIKDSPLSHQLKDQSSERLQAIETANAAFGREMLDLAAQHLGKIAQELLKA